MSFAVSDRTDPLKWYQWYFWELYLSPRPRKSKLSHPWISYGSEVSLVRSKIF